MIDLCDFEDFQNKNILEILKKEIKQKIIIENDVNCASIGFIINIHTIKIVL